MRSQLLLGAVVLGFAPVAIAAAQTPPPGVNPMSGPPPGVVVKVPAPPAGEEEKAEAALLTTFAAIQAGTPNYDDMEPQLADAVKTQKDALAGALTALGPVKTLEYQRYDPRGIWIYKGQFANGVADLIIGFGKTGKIQTLWFKPAGA